MKNLLFVFLLFAAPALAQTEWVVASDQIDVVITDSANFQPDGTPIQQRWGVPQYVVNVSDEEGDYNVKWAFIRTDTSTNRITCSLAGDRALPEPGKYNLDIQVWNQGVENGQLMVKKSPGSLRVKVHYAIPEIDLVTPADLLDGMVEIFENETSFK